MKTYGADPLAPNRSNVPRTAQCFRTYKDKILGREFTKETKKNDRQSPTDPSTYRIVLDPYLTFVDRRPT